MTSPIHAGVTAADRAFARRGEPCVRPPVRWYRVTTVDGVDRVDGMESVDFVKPECPTWFMPARPMNRKACKKVRCATPYRKIIRMEFFKAPWHCRVGASTPVVPATPDSARRKSLFKNQLIALQFKDPLGGLGACSYRFAASLRKRPGKARRTAGRALFRGSLPRPH